MEIIRNIIAFASTFVVIATFVMIACHATVRLIHISISERKEELLSFTLGIISALLLIPFYYLPY